MHVQDVEQLDSEQMAEKERETQLEGIQKLQEEEDEKKNEETKIDQMENEIQNKIDDVINLDKVGDSYNGYELPPPHEDKLPEATLERMEEVQKGWRHVREQPERKKREVYNKNIR